MVELIEPALGPLPLFRVCGSVFIGLLIGIAGRVAVGVLIRSLLYGTKPADPVVFAMMAGCLLLTATAACVIPAIRASNIEPIQALRGE